jgi:hypothetical protein
MPGFGVQESRPQREVTMLEPSRVLEPYSGLWRIPFLQECRLSEGARTRVGQMFNLSALGAYLVLDPIPRVGECYELSFCLRGNESIHVTAVVTWRNTGEGPGSADLPPGCGVRFLGLIPVECQRIHAFVKAYTTASGPASIAS